MSLLCALSSACGSGSPVEASGGSYALVGGPAGVTRVPALLVGMSTLGDWVVDIDSTGGADNNEYSEPGLLSVTGGRSGTPVFDSTGALLGGLKRGVAGRFTLLTPASSIRSAMYVGTEWLKSNANQFQHQEAEGELLPGQPALVLEAWGDIWLGLAGTVTYVEGDDVALVAHTRLGYEDYRPLLLMSGVSHGDVHLGGRSCNMLVSPGRVVGTSYFGSDAGHVARRGIVPVSMLVTVNWGSDEFPPITFNVPRSWPHARSALGRALEVALAPLDALSTEHVERGSLVRCSSAGVVEAWRPRVDLGRRSAGAARWIISLLERWREGAELGPESVDVVVEAAY